MMRHAGPAAKAGALALLLASIISAPAVAQDPVAQEVKLLVEQLRAAGSLTIDGESVPASETLAGIYEERAFAPLWTEAAVRQLIRLVRDAGVDGLDPEHYHYAALARVGARGQARTAELELLRTHAVLRLAGDLHAGRLQPAASRLRTDLSIPLAGVDPLHAVPRMITGGDLYGDVHALRPRHFAYDGLVAALAELELARNQGGWPVVPAGLTLRRGDSDARVPLLRRRLALAGDLADAGQPGDTYFDDVLETAVRSFQHRHALNTDGVIGRGTLAELNVPIERRIDQIRLNLERGRWVIRDLADTFIVVNVAGAMVYFVRDRDVVFEARAVVGRTATETPSFAAPLRYLDVNPTWTVPTGIVDEVLREVRRDRDYLRRQNMRVLDRSGQAVDPAVIDFGRYTARTFPYVFRQEPGPANPLGRIKFMFPNRYNVYLHDTPSRELFARDERTFSHGCIRLQNPFGLAELLLDDPARWNRAALDRLVAAGRTATIPLAQPIPVLVLYWTASADLHGELHFYRDVYDRDAALLAALTRRP